MRLKLTVIFYILIVLAKFACYVVTGYLAMLAEALHNVVDVLIFLTLIYSERLSAKPADRIHPLGHGLAKNLGCVVVAVVFITVIAFELFLEGIERILNPSPGRYPDIAIFVLMLTIILPLLLTFLYRGEKSVTEKSAFAELLNDIASSIGAIVGIYLTSAGISIADGVASIFIAMLISLNGYRLFKTNASYLIGRSPDESFYTKVKEIVESFPEVEDVHDIIAIYMGENKIHLDMHITVDGNMSVRDADRLTARIAKKIVEEIPEVAYILIHVCAEKGDEIRTTYDSVMRRIQKYF